MSNAFSISWKITKLSFNIFKKDRELLLFVLLAEIFLILFIVIMLVITAITFGLWAESLLEKDAVGSERMFFMNYFVLILLNAFFAYLGVAFIIEFCIFATVYTTKKRIEGKNSTFKESLKYALSKIHLIFVLSLFAAVITTLIFIVAALAQKLGTKGKKLFKYFIYFLEIGINVLMAFVVPAIVYHNLGPIKAIKKSAILIKKTWGINLIRYFGVNVVRDLFLFGGIIIAASIFYLTIDTNWFVFLIAVAIFIIYFVFISLIFSVFNAIFNTVLYIYAEKRRIYGGFPRYIIRNTFKKKASKNLRG